MGVHDTLRAPRRSRGEEDEGVVVEAAPPRRQRPLAAGGVGRFDHLDACGSEGANDLRGSAFIDHREVRTRRPREVLELEGREPAVDRDDGAAESPDGEQLGEELQAIAEMEEHALPAREPATLVAPDPTLDLTDDVGGIPSPARDRLRERADA